MQENEVLAEFRDNDGDDKQHQDSYDCDSNHPVGSHRAMPLRVLILLSRNLSLSFKVL